MTDFFVVSLKRIRPSSMSSSDKVAYSRKNGTFGFPTGNESSVFPFDSESTASSSGLPIQTGIHRSLSRRGVRLWTPFQSSWTPRFHHVHRGPPMISYGPLGVQQTALRISFLNQLFRILPHSSIFFKYLHFHPRIFSFPVAYYLGVLVNFKISPHMFFEET